MEDLNAPIEQISAETAEELIAAFDKFNRGAVHINEAMVDFNDVVRKEIVRQTVGKFLVYAEKYTNASFITRWWWKRKVFNMAQAVWDLSEFINEEILCTHRQR